MTQRENTVFNGLDKSALLTPASSKLADLEHANHYDNITPHQSSVLLLMSDDKERKSIQEFLSYEGSTVTAFDKVNECEKWWQRNDFNIIIVEVNSITDPNLIWLRNNKHIRNKGIVIISNQQDPLIRLISRKAGADDYLLKPVLHDEIQAVIENLMFRMFNKDLPTWKIQTKEWFLISPNNTVIKLTFSEKAILERLALNPGQVISKDEIAEALGYSPSVYDFRRLEIIIRRLRNKVQAQAGLRLPLDTAHRKGYSFTAEVNLLNSA